MTTRPSRLGLSRIVPMAISLMAVLLTLDVVDIALKLSRDDATPASDGLLLGSARAVAPETSTPLPAPASAKGADPAPQPPQGAGSERCAGTAACKGNAPTSPTDPEQEKLAAAIMRQREALENANRQLQERQKIVEAASRALKKQLDVLEADNSHKTPASGAPLSSHDMDRLTTIYQSMKPADAAAIFNIMDLHISVALLQQMSPRRASAIMEAMQPQRAILATQMIARRSSQASHHADVPQ